MSRSLRDVSFASPLNLGEFNPLPPGGKITVFCNADAAGDTVTIMIGGIRVAQLELGVEAAAGRGPLVPDDFVAEWRNNTASPLDIAITTTGDNDDILVFLD